MRPRTYVLLIVGVTLFVFLPSASGSLFSETFTVAEPRSGDSGLYTPGSIVIDGEAEDTEGFRFAFELGRWTERFDAYGVEREVVPFRTYAVAHEQALELPWTAWVAARASPAIVHEMDTPEILGAQVEKASFANRHNEPWGPECFFLTGLQGQTVQEGASVPLDEMCGVDLSRLAAEHDAHVAFEVAEVVSLEEGGQAARFLLTMEMEDGRAVMDLWFKDTIPYPVEMNLEGWVSPRDVSTNETGTGAWASIPAPFKPWFMALRGDHGDRGQEDDMTLEANVRLERFHRGEGGVIASTGLPGWPPSNELLEEEDEARWGPPGGEGGFPYGHEEAVEAILNDPTLAGFQAWLEQSPDARAFSSQFEETVTESQRSFAWTFHLVRGDGEAYRVTSERTVELRSPGGILEELPVPITENEAEASDAGVQPDMASFPDRLPTVSSLIDVWARLDPDTADDEGANAFTWAQPLAEGDEHLPIEVGWRDPGEGAVSFSDWGEVYSLVQVHPGDGAILEHDRENVQGGEDWMGAGMAGSAPGWSGMEFFGASDRPAALEAPLVIGIATASTLALVAVLVIKAGLGIPLYSRLTRTELLDHPTRKRLYEALEGSPGQSLGELADEGGCSASTARYHLDRLEREDLVSSAGERGARRWFPAGAMGQAAMEKHTVLSVGDTARAFEAIQEAPGASLSEVAEALDTSPPAAHKIVDRLIDAGLVEKTREGRSIALHASHEVEDIGATSEPSPGAAKTF